MLDFAEQNELAIAFAEQSQFVPAAARGSVTVTFRGGLERQRDTPFTEQNELADGRPGLLCRAKPISRPLPLGLGDRDLSGWLGPAAGYSVYRTERIGRLAMGSFFTEQSQFGAPLGLTDGPGLRPNVTEQSQFRSWR
jgi:hypothetical protein